MTAIAGDGLSATNGVLAVGVDDNSIETNSDALRIKASGVINGMLAGSIANGKLGNSAVPVWQVMVYQVVVQYHLEVLYLLQLV